MGSTPTERTKHTQLGKNMPKRVKVTKVEGRVIRSNDPAKFRIGNRKSGVSANTMSNDRLLAVVTGSNHAKDVKNALAVLNNRGQ